MYRSSANIICLPSLEAVQMVFIKDNLKQTGENPDVGKL